jgi:sulfatase modifying factor 1
MIKRTKALAIFIALTISSVLTFGNIVCASDKQLSPSEKAVQKIEKARDELEEKRKKLLEEYGPDSPRVKVIEEEIVALAQDYPARVKEAREQIAKSAYACGTAIDRLLEQGMSRTGQAVTALEAKKKELEELVEKYPPDVIASKTYSEAQRAFSRVTEGRPRGDETPAEEWSFSFAGQEPGNLRVIAIQGVSYRFRWAPPGSFMMGSPETEQGRDNDEIFRQVTLSQGFWILETEVTQSMWKSIMGNNPSSFKGADLPVESVSWSDSQGFVAALNDLGLAPAGARFALPTEAQWEYACRAGTTSPFSWGDSLNGDQANCNGEAPYGTDVKGKYLGKTAPFGSYAANPWGIFDMHGNLWEWCEDWMGPYPSGDATDPSGPASGAYRVIRGGCWNDAALRCRSAFRNDAGVDGRSDVVGFRIVLVPIAEEKPQGTETPAEE